MYDAFKNSNITVNRRNFEILAKNAVDHVRITDGDGLGDYLNDEVVSYNQLERSYVPPASAKQIRTDKAHGLFLQHPVLHYTIGTKLDKEAIKTLHENKIESVLASEKPPGFEPVMVRLLDVPEHVEDAFHQLYSTYLNRRLTDSVNTGKGSSSSLNGPSPILGISYGINFGNTGNSSKPTHK
jgi:hypothetical protein